MYIPNERFRRKCGKLVQCTSSTPKDTETSCDILRSKEGRVVLTKVDMVTISLASAIPDDALLRVAYLLVSCALS